MCNDYGNRIPYSDYLAAFSESRIPVRRPAAAPNLEPRDDIWPTDPAPTIRRLEDATNEFVILRWGFPPAKPKGAPVINFRSEGRRFPVGRPRAIGCEGAGGPARELVSERSACSRRSADPVDRRATFNTCSS